MIWILIASELLVFGIALAGFLAARMIEPQLFAKGAQKLHAFSGAFNMAVLLTSGWAAAVAQEHSRTGNEMWTRLWLGVAAALGCAFFFIKGQEYADLIKQGLDTDSGTFYMMYYLITGFHVAHVVFGVVVLGLASIVPKPAFVEPPVAFWHMVDLVWVLVFPVVYLLPLP
ncbi:MAG: cytochrome c oxidase subunit 3 family protein [Phyllobacteriaceae bacterium]|nr:cytochrome c oxidase subunit 3 family protein [Phyllobacteriaceae bacterium]